MSTGHVKASHRTDMAAAATTEVKNAIRCRAGLSARSCLSRGTKPSIALTFYTAVALTFYTAGAVLQKPPVLTGCPAFHDDHILDNILDVPTTSCLCQHRALSCGINQNRWWILPHKMLASNSDDARVVFVWPLDRTCMPCSLRLTASLFCRLCDWLGFPDQLDLLRLPGQVSTRG